MGEEAIDHGGPMWEFFRIMFIAAKEKYLCGTFFAPNVRLTIIFFNQRTMLKTFWSIGRRPLHPRTIIYAAMIIIQGAGGFPFLAKSAYKYLTRGVVLGITVENTDIADSTLHFVVTKVCISASKSNFSIVSTYYLQSMFNVD